MSYAPDLVAIARGAFGHGTLASPTRTARADNPLCGDEIELDLDVDASRIRAVAHRTQGCTFIVASASLLAQTVPTMSVSAARDLALELRRDLAGTNALPTSVAMLAGVRIYPARMRCALLPWEALLVALHEV
jgi:nitrogen fixation protein NifU and related proteins